MRMYLNDNHTHSNAIIRSVHTILIEKHICEIHAIFFKYQSYTCIKVAQFPKMIKIK